MVLEELYTYPIKSTHRVTHLQAKVEPWGLEGDRRWMIVDDNANFLTQREIPRLALIQAVPQINGNLLLSAVGSQYMHVEIPGDSAPMIQVSVWEDSVVVRVASNEVNVWLSTFLERNLCLVYMHDPRARPVVSEYAKSGTVVTFADGYPLLCTTTASLSELNRKLRHPIPMGRFRPNIVVSGDHPFGEDLWKRLRVGDVVFSVVKPCTRCVITTVDQDTASAGKEPLRTLSKFRKREGKVYFGENLVPENSGTLQRGDPVEVLEFEDQNDQRNTMEQSSV